MLVPLNILMQSFDTLTSSLTTFNTEKQNYLHIFSWDKLFSAKEPPPVYFCLYETMFTSKQTNKQTDMSPDDQAAVTHTCAKWRGRAVYTDWSVTPRGRRKEELKILRWGWRGGGGRTGYR
jgi:hypothetical protein